MSTTSGSNTFLSLVPCSMITILHYAGITCYAWLLSLSFLFSYCCCYWSIADRSLSLLMAPYCIYFYARHNKLGLTWNDRRLEEHQSIREFQSEMITLTGQQLIKIIILFIRQGKKSTKENIQRRKKNIFPQNTGNLVYILLRVVFINKVSRQTCTNVAPSKSCV